MMPKPSLPDYYGLITPVAMRDAMALDSSHSDSLALILEPIYGPFRGADSQGPAC